MLLSRSFPCTSRDPSLFRKDYTIYLYPSSIFPSSGNQINKYRLRSWALGSMVRACASSSAASPRTTYIQCWRKMEAKGIKRCWCDLDWPDLETVSSVFQLSRGLSAPRQDNHLQQDNMRSTDPQSPIAQISPWRGHYDHASR